MDDNHGAGSCEHTEGEDVVRRKPLVYVAGPITNPKGREFENAIEACKMAERVYDQAGAIPLLPHLSVFWCIHNPSYKSFCRCGSRFEDHLSNADLDCREFDMNHSLGPYDYTIWIEMALEWLSRCDALIRMPGYSPGADTEVDFALNAGIPVFEEIHGLKNWVKKWKR